MVAVIPQVMVATADMDVWSCQITAMAMRSPIMVAAIMPTLRDTSLATTCAIGTMIVIPVRGITAAIIDGGKASGRYLRVSRRASHARISAISRRCVANTSAASRRTAGSRPYLNSISAIAIAPS